MVGPCGRRLSALRRVPGADRPADAGLRGHSQVAERRAREGAKNDTQHKVPRINQLLGLILAQRQQYKEAAENMRIYLKYSTNAKDADAVKQQVDEMEKAIAQVQEKN